MTISKGRAGGWREGSMERERKRKRMKKKKLEREERARHSPVQTEKERGEEKRQ